MRRLAAGRRTFVRDALERQLRVIRITAQPPHTIRVLTRPARDDQHEGSLDTLTSRIAARVRLLSGEDLPVQ